MKIGAADIGTGARTVLTQIAADALQAEPDRVRVEIGDSALPMAGLAGVFFGGLKTSVGATDFELLQSLILLLLVYIGGINTVSGALLGGMFFAMFPVLQEHVSFLHSGSVQYLLTGLGAMSLGRNPNGVTGQLSNLGDRVRAALPGGLRVHEREPEREEVGLAGAPS